MDTSMFSRCPNCGKLELPPSLIVISFSPGAPSMFCKGEGSCTNVKCSFCGHIVNPLYHSWNECNKLRALCDLREYPMLPLRVDEVMSEAEAILKRGRDDE